MSIILSFGRWGGVYYHGGWSKRLCLGWVALTLLPADIDPILRRLLYEEGEDDPTPRS